MASALDTKVTGCQLPRAWVRIWLIPVIELDGPPSRMLEKTCQGGKWGAASAVGALDDDSWNALPYYQRWLESGGSYCTSAKIPAQKQLNWRAWNGCFIPTTTEIPDYVGAA